MKFLKIFTLIVGLSLYSSLVKAETGCATSLLLGTTIYPKLIPGESNIYIAGSTKGEIVLRGLYTPPLADCADYFESFNSNGNGYGSCYYGTKSINVAGYLVTYKTYCPIDDYIPYIITAVAGFGFIYIKRNKFAV